MTLESVVLTVPPGPSILSRACGCHYRGRNRVSGQRRYVTCEMRRWESDATGKTRVIARDAMAVGRSDRYRT